jgi:hypothetical protein
MRGWRAFRCRWVIALTEAGTGWKLYLDGARSQDGLEVFMF